MRLTSFALLLFAFAALHANSVHARTKSQCLAQCPSGESQGCSNGPDYFNCTSRNRQRNANCRSSCNGLPDSEPQSGGGSSSSGGSSNSGSSNSNSNSSGSGGSGKSNGGAIAGGVIGALLGLGAIGAGVFFWRKKQQRDRAAKDAIAASSDGYGSQYGGAAPSMMSGPTASVLPQYFQQQQQQQQSFAQPQYTNAYAANTMPVASYAATTPSESEKGAVQWTTSAPVVPELPSSPQPAHSTMQTPSYNTGRVGVNPLLARVPGDEY